MDASLQSLLTCVYSRNLTGTGPGSAIRRQWYVPPRIPPEPVGASSCGNIDGAASMAIGFSKWPGDDKRIIVRRLDAYIGFIRKGENDWAPSLDLPIALSSAGDRRRRARMAWQSGAAAIREIRKILSAPSRGPGM